MAEVTFNAAHRREHVREQKTVLAAFREMLDLIVSNQMRRAAAEARQAHRRQRLVSPAESTKSQ